MIGAKFWQTSLATIARIGVTPNDDESTRLEKIVIVVTALMISVAAVVWGGVYLFLNEPLAASIPLLYSVFSITTLLILSKIPCFGFFRFTQLFLILLLPFLLMLALGGFINGSAVVLWALLAPLGALLGGQSRQAVYWFLAYIALVIISGLGHSYLRLENNLPQLIIIIFFVLNVGAVSTIAFLVLNYFVKQKDLVMELMRKNRELEEAYLQQEITLRQSEKLATLGKLSAGIAHELNNPAAAVRSAVAHLHDAIKKLGQDNFRAGQFNLATVHLEELEPHKQLISERAKQPISLDPLTRSDQEHELETWLDDKGVEDAWELAPILVSIGYTSQELSSLVKSFTDEKIPVVVSLLSRIYSTRNLLEEIGEGAGRIIEIVQALKSYSFLDQAEIQSIDIHKGLNDTLIMLRSKLKDRIEVQIDYAKDLPRIDAYGSELNQVWTNILDNAIGAMEGQGKIVLRTYREGSWIVVEIKDNGPGIPQDIQNNIFDPFFSTKEPGEGTGLGLNVSHNIIVRKHKGKIIVDSRPGETCFKVKLPINLENSQIEA